MVQPIRPSAHGIHTTPRSTTRLGAIRLAPTSLSLILLRPYKEKYLAQAVRVRETVTYAYQHGGASLMDFLNAQSDYRTVELAYVQLIGSYLTAAGQLNLAVGREVIQ